jgi:diacylglycerol kinase (ATP)
VRVTLLHNPGAGEEDHQAEELRSLVAAQGHQVTYRSLDADDWKRALDDPGDLLVVAGGDGSVGKVFLELATKDVAVTLLPVGSANNLARTLGLADSPLEQLAEGWHDGELRRFDVGEASAPWGDALFVESVGGGIFGDVLERAEEIDTDEAEGDEKVHLGLELMLDAIERAPARSWGVEVDGVDLSAHFLAVEVTNIREIGPNFPLAPQADPGDGLLDVVLVREEHREALAGYFEDRLSGVDPRPQPLSTRRGARVVLRPPDDSLLHVDDEFWPDDPKARGGGAATLSAGRFVLVLVPRL